MSSLVALSLSISVLGAIATCRNRDDSGYFYPL